MTYLPTATVLAIKTTASASGVTKQTEAKPGDTKHDTGKMAETKATTASPSGAVTIQERAFQSECFFLVVAFVLGLAAMCVYSMWREKRPQDRIQPSWAWFGVGLLGAVGHMLFVDSKAGTSWEPVFDTTTLFWGIFATLGFLYTRITDLSVGTVAIKLESAREKADTVVTAATELSASWTSDLKDLLAEFESAVDQDDAGTIVTTFLRDRARAAIQWFGETGEYRRLIFWLHDPEADELYFFLSNEVTPETNPAVANHRFKKGVGLIWGVFGDGTIVNRSNMKAISGFVPIKGDRSNFHGLVMVRMEYNGRPFGVVSVDREYQEKFDVDGVNVIRALAALAAIALEQKTIKAAYLPPPVTGVAASQLP